MTRATSDLLVIADPGCLSHVPFPGHPERPERWRVARDVAVDLGAEVVAPSFDDATARAAVSLVHDASLADRLESACRRGPQVFDAPDNPISAGTFAAALRAVACGLEAAARVEVGERRPQWLPIRPPGHHALRDRAMGFCFFNTVAIVAEDLLRRGIGPLAVIDFDVHHGNGTQTHFWRRGEVFYLSLHQYPAYPGTGRADETGEGAGSGATRNIPLAAGADDEIFCGALEVGLDEVRHAMSPAVVLVSAGFDGHVDDPLSGFRITEEGYRQTGRSIADLAGGLPVISVLEGGYELASLGSSVRAYLEGLGGAASP